MGVRMRGAKLVIALIVAAGVGSLTTAVVAQTESAQPVVVNAHRVQQRVGDDSQVRVANLLRGEQAYMGRWALAPNAQTSPRSAAAETYLYVLEGSGVAMIAGQSYIVGPHMAVYVPAGAELSFTNGAERLVAVQVYAPGEEAARYQEWRLRDDGESWPRRRTRPRVRTRQSALPVEAPSARELTLQP
ncbi:cupin domain-containing protein [Bradymonadaceae bacterium TMQ3]|nr:cupin domain-containing protein [Bradymonadaceae bacterium TMQ3]TXC76475.1 cupin domain-containing protein [Bradymonadales bacterium TMQ1]